MFKTSITQSRLKELLNYNPDTGIFTWKVCKGSKVKVGDVAGCTHYHPRTNKFYITIGIDYKLYRAHRLAWLYMTGGFPKDQIDHIDQNSLNNAINNLRDVSNQVNGQNRKIPKNNISGVLGISWYKRDQKWRVQICVNSKMIHLGYFANKVDAVICKKMADYEFNFHPNHGR